VANMGFLTRRGRRQLKGNHRLGRLGSNHADVVGGLDPDLDEAPGLKHGISRGLGLTLRDREQNIIDARYAMPAAAANGLESFKEDQTCLS
jgi:hypothetical protein